MPAFQIIPAGPALLPLPVAEFQPAPFETYGPPAPVETTTQPPTGPYPAKVEISSTFESDSGVVSILTEEQSTSEAPATEAPTTHQIHKEVFQWKKPKVIKIWKPKLVFTKKIIKLPDIWSLLKKHH